MRFFRALLVGWWGAVVAIPAPPPAGRTLTVDAESRYFSLAAESRYFAVDAETRTFAA